MSSFFYKNFLGVYFEVFTGPQIKFCPTLIVAAWPQRLYLRKYFELILNLGVSKNNTINLFLCHLFHVNHKYI